jgi:hypothetical protein
VTPGYMRKYYCNQCSQEFTRKWNFQRHTRYMHGSYNGGLDLANFETRIHKDTGYLNPSSLGFDLPGFRRRLNPNRSPTYKDYLRLDLSNLSATYVNSAYNFGFNTSPGIVSKRISYQFWAPPPSGHISIDNDMWKTFLLEKIIDNGKILRDIRSTLKEILYKIK